MDNTNVKTLLMGRGAAKNISNQVGKHVVLTMDIPWEVTKDKIGGVPEKVIMVESIEQDWLDQQITNLPQCDTIIGIGGGQAIDAAKYFCLKTGKRLVSIPTIISVNAFVTPDAGIRQNHQVVYLGPVSPEPLIIDFDIIRSAPPALNIAGVGDLLSMHTASFDWTHAHNKGKSEYEFSQSAIDKAQAILDELYAVMPEIKKNSDTGLKAIVDGYMKLNTICLPAGHFRVEEGSEHYLFYELEARLKRPFIHGDIVGLGIYCMSRLQGNKPEEITRIMDEAGIHYHPKYMDIKRTDLIAALLNLRNFVESNNHLWYTAINDSNITEAWANEVCDGLVF